MGPINLKILERKKTSQPAFSRRMAYLCAKFSEASYIEFEKDEIEKLERFLDAAGFIIVDIFSHNGSEAYLATNNDFAVIVFRGTQPSSLKDIKSDLDCDKILTVYGKAHEGFLKYYNRIGRKINVALEKITVPIYITGHSLGGAAAGIASALITNNNVIACYTFGAPRIGDKIFISSIQLPVYRVVNYVDPVPLLPAYVSGWRHPGDLRYITKRGKISTNTASFDRAKSFLFSLFTQPKNTFDYHGKDEYSKRLEKIALEK